MHSAGSINNRSTFWDFSVPKSSVPLGLALAALGVIAATGFLPGPGVYYGPPLIALGLIIGGAGLFNGPSADPSVKEFTLNDESQITLGKLARKYPNLEQLTVDKYVPKEELPALAQWEHLKSLTFTEGAEMDVRVVSFPPHLKTLALSGQLLGDISKFLKNLPINLERFDISITSLKGRDLDFSYLKKLRTLSLTCTELTDKEIETLLFPSSLRELHLQENCWVSTEGLKDFITSKKIIDVLHSCSNSDEKLLIKMDSLTKEERELLTQIKKAHMRPARLQLEFER